MCVGRIAREKRLDMLMDAFRILRARTHRRLGLVMVGSGPAEAELRRRQVPGVHSSADRQTCIARTSTTRSVAPTPRTVTIPRLFLSRAAAIVPMRPGAEERGHTP